MTKQNDSFKMAVAQMVELSKELLVQEISSYSKLNQCENDKERRELEKLYYNEIAATANVIRLFTGREISFQWQRGASDEFKGGFALYEIREDAPCDEIPARCPTTLHSRYSGKQEPDKRVKWSEGIDQGKIVKIYERIYNKNANPCYTGGYQVSELQMA